MRKPWGKRTSCKRSARVFPSHFSAETNSCGLRADAAARLSTTGAAGASELSVRLQASPRRCRYTSADVLERAFQSLLADLAVQGRATDAEATGDFGHVTGVDLDGVLDEVALDLLQGAQMTAVVEDADGGIREGRQVQAGDVERRQADHGRALAVRMFGRQEGGSDAGDGGEVVRLEEGRVGQDYGAIDRVLELADVAGPV